MSAPVKVVLFASIREAVGEGELRIDELAESAKLSTLVALLCDRFGEAAREALTAENVRIAVNQELVHEDVVLNAGDEVAFFPPVTGG